MEQRILPPEFEKPRKFKRKGQTIATLLFTLFTVTGLALVVWLSR